MAMKQDIQVMAEHLADFCLSDPGMRYEYEDRDMFNAALIFAHFLLDKTCAYHKDKVTNEQMNLLAIEAGKSIRQTIQVFTGLDMHAVANKNK